MRATLANEGPLIDRRYRRHASIVGAVFMALFLGVLLWILASPSMGMGGGIGPGSGGGRGGGSGGGIGTAHGPGTGAGPEEAPGAGNDPHSIPADEMAGGAPSDADAAPPPEPPRSDAAPPTRPPLRVGFSAADASTPPPVPPAPAPTPRGRTGGGAGGGGGGGDHSFMGVEGRGRTVVYVIDRSGSMQGDRIAHTRYELKRSIRALGADGEFFVIFFNQGALAMPAPGLAPATNANKDRYSKWIDQQEAGGGTDPTDAMLQALALKPDAIYLMSDGVFSAAAADAIRAANKSGCRINTIAFHDRSGEELLHRIANENAGEYRFVAPP